MRIRFVLLAAFVMLAATVPMFGQTIDDLRDELSKSLHDAQYAAGFAGMIILADELELSGAHYEINDGDANLSNTELRSLALPFQKPFYPWGKDAFTSIYTEGVLGYASNSRQAKDIYSGLAPGLETSVDSDYKTYGGLIGIGPQFKILEGLRVAPILNGGVAYIDNSTDYGGPGAAATAQLLDGIAFNWNGWTVSGGGALRADWVKPLGKDYELELVGRYDIRWVQTFDADDSAQEFSTRYQMITLRADVVGPTGLTPFDRALYWRATTGYRHFFEGSLFDVHDIILVGGGLEYDIVGVLPIGKRLKLSGGLIFGEDITGYTFGVGVAF